jgi:hypothetical protein
VRGADVVPPPTPRGRSIEPRDDAPVTAKDSRELLNRSRSPRRPTIFGDMSQDEQEELRAALLQLYAMQQIAEKQARGKASRAVKKVVERLALTM